MIHNSKLCATDFNTLQKQLDYIQRDWVAQNTKEANVLALHLGGGLISAKVNPPNRDTHCYFYNPQTQETTDTEIDVVELFTEIQQRCVCWCEI